MGSKITAVHALEILDSRGNPTVRVHVTLDNGVVASASCRPGLRRAKNEALELRDGDKKRYGGKGVLIGAGARAPCDPETAFASGAGAAAGTGVGPGPAGAAGAGIPTTVRSAARRRLASVSISGDSFPRANCRDPCRCFPVRLRASARQTPRPGRPARLGPWSNQAQKAANTAGVRRASNAGRTNGRSANSPKKSECRSLPYTHGSRRVDCRATTLAADPNAPSWSWRLPRRSPP